MIRKTIKDVSRKSMILILVIAATIAPLSGGSATTTETVQEHARQRENDHFEQAEATIFVTQQRQELAEKALQVKKRLEALQTRLEVYGQRMQALLYNDDGKRIASDKSSFMLFRRLEDRKPTTLSEVKICLERAESLLATTKLSKDEPKARYMPSESTREQLYQLEAWTKVRLDDLENQEGILNSLVATAPDDIDLEATLTLFEMKQYVTLEDEKAIVSFIEAGQREAAPDRGAIISDSARQADILSAQSEGNRLLAETQMDQEMQDHRQDLDHRDKRRIMDQEQADANMADEINTRDIARQILATQLKLDEEDTASQIDRQKRIQALTRQKNLALLQTTELQTLLAPFLAKGYWTPGEPLGTYDFAPMSLSAMARYGALSRTVLGLEYLLRLGINPYDTERTKWPYPNGIQHCSAQQRAEIVKAQQYLIELGPLMVEQKMLAP